MRPEDFMRHFIEVHESGRHSLDRTDTGNWYQGQLVGSKWGVTGAALAKFRKVSRITQADMAALTLNEAVNLGLQDYYRAPKLDRLPFDRVIAAVIDMGFNAGPKRAIELLQQMIGADDDGDIGAGTLAAYLKAKANESEEELGHKYANKRIAYYNELVRRRPANAKYIKGWTNRANSFRPGTSWWNASR